MTRVGLLAGTVSLRMLDETTANEALPTHTHTDRAPWKLSLAAGEASIDLTPFAIARLDTRRCG